MTQLSEPGTGRAADSVGRAEIVGLLLLLAAAAVIRGLLLDSRSLWFDEAFSFQVARLPVSQILQALRDHDPHPPLHYLSLHLWLAFGDTPEALRSLSAVAGVLTVWATWAFSRRIGGPATGLAAAALVAFSALGIQASVEARMYPLLGLLVVLGTYVLWRAVLSPDSWGLWASYAAAMSLALYTDYFALLVLAGHAAYVATHHIGHFRARLGFLLAVLAVVAVFAPWLAVLALQYGRGMLDTYWKGPMAPGAPLNFVALSGFGGHVLRFGGYLLEYRHWSWLQVAAVIPLLCLAAHGAVRLPDRRAGILLGLTWLAPVLLLVGVSLATGTNYAIGRYVSFIQPFFAILMAKGVLNYSSRCRGSAVVGAGLVGLLVIANLAVLRASVADPRYQVFNWAAAAGHVEARWQPGDAILYFPPTARIAFGYYFRKAVAAQAVVEMPRYDLGMERREWANFVPRLPVEIRDARRVWFVYTIPWPPGSLEALLQALDRQYWRHDHADFQEVWTVLYARKGSE